MDLLPDPIAQFSAWYAEAEVAGAPQPDAMALATASPGGVPSVRFVLLKRCDERGFMFFSDRRSLKGGELAANPQAALVIFWHPTHHQVRAAGKVARLPRAETEEYWSTRPRAAQAAARASHQSQPVNRALLEAEHLALLSRFEGRPIPLPPYWTGYRLQPEWIEFWESRPDRLHERVRFERRGRAWRALELAP